MYGFKVSTAKISVEIHASEALHGKKTILKIYKFTAIFHSTT